MDIFIIITETPARGRVIITTPARGRVPSPDIYIIIIPETLDEQARHQPRLAHPRHEFFMSIKTKVTIRTG